MQKLELKIFKFDLMEHIFSKKQVFVISRLFSNFFSILFSYFGYLDIDLYVCIKESGNVKVCFLAERGGGAHCALEPREVILKSQIWKN